MRRAMRGCLFGVVGAIIATVVGNSLFQIVWHGPNEPPGLIITNVVSGSPADDAGLRVGGLLESLDGVRLYDLSDLRRVVRANPGVPLIARIKYNGNYTTVNVVPRRLSSGAGYLGIDAIDIDDGPLQ